MFNFQSFQKYMPGFTLLFVTAVALAQSETGSALLAALMAMVNGQPQGF